MLRSRPLLATLLFATLALPGASRAAARDGAPAGPATVVVLGATGDLTSRMLVPALVELEKAGSLPRGTRLVGFALPSPDIRGGSDAAFRQFLAGRTQRMAPGGWDAAAFERLAPRVHFQEGDLGDAKAFDALRGRLESVEGSRGAGAGAGASRIFYLALPPKLIAPTLERLQAAGLVGRGVDARVVVEKPIGVDLASARAINDHLEKIVGEDRVYRMDHYLGKENVRNLLTLRFADPRFQSIWNKRYIDRIEVRAHEKVAIEGRGGFYEPVGATRDMVQSHLLQVVALATMDRPGKPGADGVRDAKIKLLESLRPMGPEEVARDVVRGQYGGEGGYLQQPGVARGSKTETYVAMRLGIEGRRWAGVPIHLVTGKALRDKTSEVVVHFRQLPPELAAQIGQSPGEPATLRIGIDPKPTLTLAGKPLALPPSRGPALAPYARQLADVLRGDQSMFLHRRETEAAWRFVDPIVAAWKQASSRRPYPYQPGSLGPRQARQVLPKGSLDRTPPDELARARQARVGELASPFGALRPGGVGLARSALGGLPGRPAAGPIRAAR